MNATSIVTSVTVCGTSSRRQRARVDAFAHDDARVGAQPPIELAVADVERDDAGGAAPQQHVGEAAGRRADVERAASLRVDRERVERVRELDAAAADVRMIRRRRARRRASAATGAPAFETTWPSTVTWPARISARARSRDGASPRSTSATSSRVLLRGHKCTDHDGSAGSPECVSIPSRSAVTVLARHDPVRDRQPSQPSVRPASVEASRARARGIRRRARAIVRGRRAPDRSAWRRRRPCRRSCRAPRRSPSTSRMSSTI